MRRSSDRGVESDRGVATVWSALIVAVLVVVSLAMCWLGAAAIVRHRAEVAADLGALAAAGGAQHEGIQHEGTQRDPGTACARALRVVRAMGVRLTACRIEAADALVEVDAELPAGLVRFGSVGARARAGPAALPP